MGATSWSTRPDGQARPRDDALLTPVISIPHAFVSCHFSTHGTLALGSRLWGRTRRRRLHDEGFMPSHLPGEDKRLAPIALGLRSLDGIQDMHGAARDLYHHDGMRRWRMAEQVTLHTDNRIVAAPYPLTEVIEAPVLVERRTRASVDEAGVSGRQCDAETGTPEDGADLFFRPHHTEPCQHHAHTGGHA